MTLGRLPRDPINRFIESPHDPITACYLTKWGARLGLWLDARDDLYKGYGN